MGDKLDKIVEIIDDISDDIDHNTKSATDMYYSVGDYSWNARRNGRDFGTIKTLFPNIVGFLLGLAITKMFGGGGAGYLVLGAIFSIVFGVFYSVEFQKIALRYAIIRHIIIVAGIALMFGIVCLIEK
ncbi:MAG: hypothetical protein IKK66_09945 [Ruminococcus sp.]|nr:hypothetical protein [Ruminococcus sp.]